MIKPFAWSVMIVVFMALATHAGGFKKPTGTIVLTTDAGARVWIDNRNAGTTTKEAFTINQVPVGRHTLKISKPNYHDHTDGNVSVTAGQTTNLGVIPLRIILGSIRVTSTPTGAAVFLDGQSKGTTSNNPLMIKDVAPGLHNLGLMKTNYAEYRRDITVNPNRTTNLTVSLLSIVGTITLIPMVSDTTGAAVFLDGQNKGTMSSNPFTITEVAAGIHNLRVTKEGYVDSTVSAFELRGGGEVRFNISLTPNPGIILVGSSPGGANINLSGEPKGTTPDTGQVSVSVNMAPGEYSRTKVINLEKEGYDRYRQRVTVPSGQTRDLGTVLLVPHQQAPVAREGFLWVGSIPPDATVFLGEVRGASAALSEKGKGSLFIEGLTPGTRYRVKLQRRGFREKIRDYMQGVGGMGMFIRLEPEPPPRR